MSEINRETQHHVRYLISFVTTRGGEAVRRYLRLDRLRIAKNWKKDYMHATGFKSKKAAEEIIANLCASLEQGFPIGKVSKDALKIFDVGADGKYRSVEFEVTRAQMTLVIAEDVHPYHADMVTDKV